MARGSMKVYIGWTGEGSVAYEVCKATLLARSSIPLEVYPLKHWELRSAGLYTRPYFVSGTGQRYDGLDASPFSTDFSFSRFLVPALADYSDEWVLYCDNDMLWLEDVAKLFATVEGSDAIVACVKHGDYDPSVGIKMTGVVQSPYPRKNWSSLMLMHPIRLVDRLTAATVNLMPGKYLHQFKWAHDDEIAQLPARWNVLLGEQIHDDPAVLHFTNGTPDMVAAGPQDVWGDLWNVCARVVSHTDLNRISGALGCLEGCA